MKLNGKTVTSLPMPTAKKKGKREPASRLEFIAPEGIDIKDAPEGISGALYPLKPGQVLLVATYPETTTHDELAWVRRACEALVDDGVAEYAVFLPEGWKLQVVHAVEEKPG